MTVFEPGGIYELLGDRFGKIHVRVRVLLRSQQRPPQPHHEPAGAAGLPAELRLVRDTLSVEFQYQRRDRRRLPAVDGAHDRAFLGQALKRRERHGALADAAGAGHHRVLPLGEFLDEPAYLAFAPNLVARLDGRTDR